MPNPIPKKELNQMNKITNHSLFEQIKNLVNSSMTMMYWHIGKLIKKTNIIHNTAKRSELK